MATHVLGRVDTLKRFKQLSCVLTGCLLFASYTFAASFSAYSTQAREYAIKAAYLYNLAIFMDLPESDTDHERAPFVVCVLGEDPFGAALDEMKARKIGERPVEIYRSRELQGVLRCQLLFICNSEKNRLEEILHSLKGDPVITVGESEDFLKHGGIVQFVNKKNNVRFSFNVDAAEDAGIRIGSKLQRLAVHP